MLNQLKKESNKTCTENGALTLKTTNSYCLDLFSTIGALRYASDQEIVGRFLRAYAENKDRAMKILFFARDVRGGLGERKVFRSIVSYVAKTNPESIIKNIAHIAEYGRYDDLLELIGTPCEQQMIRFIKMQLDRDMQALQSGKTVSLLGKWLPSENASNKKRSGQGKYLAGALGMSSADYRKALTSLRAHIRIIENNLRVKDYSFEYEKQPSRALFKYRAAFLRNDSEKYNEFVKKVNKGEAKLNASNIAPYELVFPLLRKYQYAQDNTFVRMPTEEEKNILNATWASLPDFGSDENILPVIDTSGSMYGFENSLPAAVALSLGLYCAERNKGLYRNHFVEFSDIPQLIEIKGETFVDKLSYLGSFCRMANTDIQAMFDFILETAVVHRVPQDELPTKLVIISDMEFDRCVCGATTTNFEFAKKKFEENGYRLPQIIFWNVASRKRHQPVTMNEQGVALVSGVTPKLFEMIAGGIFSPYQFMIDILESERYEPIAA